MPTGDLINESVLQHPGQLPPVMSASVLDVNAITGQLVVRVPAIDGGKSARRAFGSWPNALEGDAVRVALDDAGALVVVAWEPT